MNGFPVVVLLLVQLAVLAVADCGEDSPGGTCYFSKCFSWRGATKCGRSTGYQCKCQDGSYTVRGSSCVKSEVECCNGQCQCKNNSLEPYQKAKGSINGCGPQVMTSVVGDIDIGEKGNDCCRVHDWCYDQPNAKRTDCDSQFCRCVKDASPVAGTLLCSAVEAWNDDFFHNAQVHAIGCK